MFAIPTWLAVFGSGCPDPEQNGTADGLPRPDSTLTYGLSDSAIAGFVYALSGSLGEGAAQPTPTSVTAGFSTNDGNVGTCTKTSLDDQCFELSCLVTQVGQPVWFGAGILDVAGLLEPVQLVEGPYEGVYPSFFVAGAPSYYVPGADVTVTASGDDVPAFTLTAPTPDQNLTVTDPPPPIGALPETVPRDADRHFAWIAPTLGKVTVRLALLTGRPDETRVIQCTRLGDPLINEMVVPLSQVEEFDAQSAIESISYSSDATTIAGQFAVTLELASPVRTPEGAPYGSRTLLFE
jgi:hypothetical protein